MEGQTIERVAIFSPFDILVRGRIIHHSVSVVSGRHTPANEEVREWGGM